MAHIWAHPSRTISLGMNAAAGVGLPNRRSTRTLAYPRVDCESPCLTPPSGTWRARIRLRRRKAHSCSSWAHWQPLLVNPAGDERSYLRRS